MKVTSQYVVMLLLLLVGAASVSAQNVNGSLGGAVTDAAGAPVVGASVRVKQTDREWRRDIATDESGQFRFTALPPGEYEIEVEGASFAVYRSGQPIKLLAGDAPFLNINLAPQGVAEAVTVAGEFDEISRARTTGSRGGKFDERENTALPMVTGGVSRNFRTQVYLLPGVVPSANRAAHAPFAINGLRPVNTVNVMVDGADFNNPSSGALLGTGLAEQPVSQEVLVTTEVQTNNYKAEYGRAAGGTINLVTRGGGNLYHGKAWNFLRNDAFDARNPLLNRRLRVRRNQFGFALEGPVLKDRLFFNVSGEGVADRSARNRNPAFTFTEAERASAAAPVRELLGLYPLPNVAGTNLFNPGDFISRQGGHFYFGRLDFIASQNHLLTFRATKSADQPVNLFQGFGQATSFVSDNRSYVLSAASTLTPNVTNEARVYYTQRTSDSIPESYLLGDSAANGRVGIVNITGAERLGGLFRDYVKVHNYQTSNDVTWARGRHTLKFGGVFRHIQYNSTARTQADGVLTFNSRADFLAARPAVYTRAFGDPRLDQRANEFAAYVQDDFRISSNLQFNFGARYEVYTTPADKYGRVALNYDTDRNNFAPRLGFAWTPGEQTDLVVRGGYGIFFTPLPMRYIGDTRFTPPNLTTFTFFRPMFPDLTAGQGSLNANRTITSPDIEQPYAQQYNLTVDYRLFGDQVVSAAYVGTRASHLGITRLPNGGAQLPVSAANPRPLASQYGNGVITLLETSGSSNYNALQLATRGRLARNLDVRTSYTWAKAIDDISFDNALFIDEDDRRLDRAVSDFDIRHNFNLSVLYGLPSSERLPRFLRPVLNGWQTATIVSARSALPFSILSGTPTPDGSAVNRIDDVPGSIVRTRGRFRSLRLADNLAVRDVVRGFAGFTTPTPIGTLGRNSERGDAFYDVSLGVHKDFAFTERLRSQVRLEVFNLFNTTNFDSYINNLANPAFGTATTVFSPRTMQLAFRFSF